MRERQLNEFGFTLIELMAAIAIAAIVLTIAIPSFIETVKNNRLTVVANDFVTTVNIARSESVKRGQRVTICKSSDGATCIASGDWSQGWIVFNNPNNNAAVDGGSGEAIIRLHSAFQQGITIIGSTVALASRFSYLPNGTISNVGSISICDDRVGNFGKNIIFVTTGRARTTSGNAC